MSKNPSIRVVLPPGILSYPALDVAAEPTESSTNKTPKFQATLVYPSSETFNTIIAVIDGQRATTSLADVIKRVIAAKFGADKVPTVLAAVGNGKRYKSPIRIDGEKGDEPKYAKIAGPNARFLRSSSTIKPQCVYPDLRLMTDDEIKRDLYAGCKAKASVNVAWFDKEGNAGITLYLNNVQKIGEGERISNMGVPATSDFDAVETTEADANDLANLLGN